MLLGVGLLHGSRIWSYAQMMMDCEIFDIVFRMMGGIVVNEETLALDTIHKVGPHGNFLTQKHTRQHMRDIWVPKYMDRRPFEVWLEKGDNAPDWAKAKAAEIYSDHQPDPLDPKISQEFIRIIASVEKG
jgi:trimethylamine--corrinoid protein Co-methyltransferase